MDDVGSTNALCADRLREAADLLEAQRANPCSVSACRKVAATVIDLPEDHATIVEREYRGTAKASTVPAIAPVRSETALAKSQANFRVYETRTSSILLVAEGGKR